MRIIAGSARGMRLRVPRGTRVRPTSGRVRTSLFSILGETVEGARVADLFAGCGALGLEALSRGAAFCCFVETAPAAVAALEENLARSGLGERAEVVRDDVFALVPALEARRPFDVVFLDPPYSLVRRRPGHFVALLEELAGSRALCRDALVVFQHEEKTPLPAATGPLATTDTRTYGTTVLTFLERPPARDDG